MDGFLIYLHNKILKWDHPDAVLYQQKRYYAPKLVWTGAQRQTLQETLRLSNALNNFDYKRVKRGEREGGFVKRILWRSLLSFYVYEYPSSCPWEGGGGGGAAF